MAQDNFDASGTPGDFGEYTTNFNQKWPSILNNIDLQTAAEEIPKNLGLYKAASSSETLYNSFNTFRIAEGIDYFSSNVTYIFFTKPQMNLLYSSYLGDDFLQTLKESNADSSSRRILEQLDGKMSNSGCFNFLLSNSAESFDLKDNILKTAEIGETRLGTKIMLGDNAMESYNSGSFTVEYTEYSDLSIVKMHKAWMDYIHLVKHGKVTPFTSKQKQHPNIFNLFNGEKWYSYTQNQNTGLDFVKDKIIDYACSVYYFKLAEDGRTIRYWAKYTGVFPTNIPFSSLSFALGDNKLKQINVEYAYSFKEDMTTGILEEFRDLCNKSGWEWNGANESTVTSIADNWSSGVSINKELTKLVFLK